MIIVLCKSLLVSADISTAKLYLLFLGWPLTLRQHNEIFVSAKAHVKLDCDLASTSMSLYVGLAYMPLSFRG